MFFVSLSYKVPAKGDGVDYVRTEDEVCRRHLNRYAWTVVCKTDSQLRVSLIIISYV